jgi:prepilin-type N-terminal cleavage/methylation domain-containing protein
MKNNKGFTLLEVIAAIFILTVGAGASFALIQQTLSAASLVEDRLIASYLAQEGVEVVKNIRDQTWLEKRTNLTLTWDEYLPEGDLEADYLSQ